MRIVSKLACVTLLGLLILKTTVQAADIPLDNLPDDIKQLLATINATPVKAHERGHHYEVTVKNPDGSTMELFFKTVHVLVTTETPVNSLNVNITNAVNQRYPGSTILKAEQILNGANAPCCYKLQLQLSNSQARSVHILPTGQFFYTPNDGNQATGNTTRQQVQQLVNDARTAIRNKHFDVANNKLQNASQLAPQDPDVQRAINELNVAMANATKVHLKANVQGSNRVHHGDSVQVQVNVDRGRTDSFQGPVALTVNLPSGIAPQNVGAISIPQGQTSTVVNLTVQADASPGDKQVGITGQAVGMSNVTNGSATCTINVQKRK